MDAKKATTQHATRRRYGWNRHSIGRQVAAPACSTLVATMMKSPLKRELGVRSESFRLVCREQVSVAVSILRQGKMRLASRTVDNRERERYYTAHTEPRRAATKHARPTNAHFAGTGSSGIFSIPQRNSECSLSHVHRHSRRLPPRRWPLCACVHLSHSSCLTSPGWGPYSLLASGQRLIHFTAGHDSNLFPE